MVKKEYKEKNMSMLSEINETVNETLVLKNNINKTIETIFDKEDQFLVYETAADILKNALQAIQTGQPVEDPALVGGLLVLAKGEVRKDLNVTAQKLGLYANYAGRSDRINQELRQYGAGAKIDPNRLQTDDTYRNEIMSRLQKLVGAYDKVAKEAHQGAEQIKATRAAPSYAQEL
jgi:hypothetical protein